MYRSKIAFLIIIIITGKNYNLVPSILDLAADNPIPDNDAGFSSR